MNVRARRLSPIFVIFQEICFSRQVIKVRHMIKVRHFAYNQWRGSWIWHSFHPAVTAILSIFHSGSWWNKIWVETLQPGLLRGIRYTVSSLAHPVRSSSTFSKTKSLKAHLLRATLIDLSRAQSELLVICLASLSLIARLAKLLGATELSRAQKANFQSLTLTL